MNAKHSDATFHEPTRAALAEAFTAERVRRNHDIWLRGNAGVLAVDLAAVLYANGYKIVRMPRLVT